MIPLPHGTYTNEAREQQQPLHNNYYNYYSGQGKASEDGDAEVRKAQKGRRRTYQANDQQIEDIGNGEGSRPRDGYLITSLMWQPQKRLVSDASRQPGELYCMFGSSQRSMRKLAGSREGIEQHGVADDEDIDERRPAKPNYHNTTTQQQKSAKASGYVTVYKCKIHNEDQVSGGEPNHSTTLRMMSNPQQKHWSIRCSETRGVSGTSKAAVSHNSCADQLHHFVQGQISLVLTLRLLSREMQSWGGARISLS